MKKKLIIGIILGIVILLLSSCEMFYIHNNVDILIVRSVVYKEQNSYFFSVEGMAINCIFNTKVPISAGDTLTLIKISK
mgnify:CR=1 FL=1